MMMNESRDQELAEGARGRDGAGARISPARRRALLRTAASSVPLLLVTAPSIAAASTGYRAPTPRVSPGHARPAVSIAQRGTGTPVRAQDLGPAREIAQAMNKFR